MSHVTGTVQTVSPVAKLGPDFGPAANPPNTWTLNFAHVPAPTRTKLLILHFPGASFPANNRLEVDLGHDMDVFTPADGTDFWTRPINIYALAGGVVPILYITNGAATGAFNSTSMAVARGMREFRIPRPSPSAFRSKATPPTRNRNTIHSGSAAPRSLGEHRLRQTAG